MPFCISAKGAASFPGPFRLYNCCFGFRHVKVYCNSDNALAGIIRKIRSVSYMSFV